MEMVIDTTTKPLNQNKMKIIHLINETYQVVSEDERIVYFQGSKDDCERYRMTKLFNL
jgi:hypothetical protein